MLMKLLPIATNELLLDQEELFLIPLEEHIPHISEARHQGRSSQYIQKQAGDDEPGSCCRSSALQYHPYYIAMSAY